MAICVECVFMLVHNSIKDCCSNPELPITDFLYGVRECKKLNAKGNCEGFKAKPQPESIYASEKDEKLAKG